MHVRQGGAACVMWGNVRACCHGHGLAFATAAGRRLIAGLAAAPEVFVRGVGIARNHHGQGLHMVPAWQAYPGRGQLTSCSPVMGTGNTAQNLPSRIPPHVVHMARQLLRCVLRMRWYKGCSMPPKAGACRRRLGAIAASRMLQLVRGASPEQAVRPDVLLYEPIVVIIERAPRQRAHRQRAASVCRGALRVGQ